MSALEAFLRAALVPPDRTHTSGDLAAAERIVASTSGLPGDSIHAAAVLGDDRTVARLLERDPGSVAEDGGPYGWDPLTHLCFSRYLRLEPARSDGFIRAATALLDAGADPNGGWFEESHQPTPCWESVLYGAAGVAHHTGLTRLLLERGADPNDGETPYHAPEQWDLPTVQALVESGRLTEESLGTMLVRMADWHHAEAIRWTLGQGVPADAMSPFGTALPHAILRDNGLEIIDLFLDHGADPTREVRGRTPIQLAARGGRRDVLESLDRRGVPIELAGSDGLMEACARGDQGSARRRAAEDPRSLEALRSRGAETLGRFSGTGNAAGVRILLDLGVPVDARWSEGDGYYGIARNSTALHVAAWRMSNDVVAVLLDRGADPDARDGRGRTPLVLAVEACVDSYWKERRTPDAVEALLGAGASLEGVRFPSGYEEVDRILVERGAERTGEAEP